jgi:hypothetical protein
MFKALTMFLISLIFLSGCAMHNGEGWVRLDNAPLDIADRDAAVEHCDQPVMVGITIPLYLLAVIPGLIMSLITGSIINGCMHDKGYVQASAK